MDKQNYQITKVSKLTGVTHQRVFAMTLEQFAEYSLPRHKRRPLQLIFPEMSVDDREFLLSGITPEEWDEHFWNGRRQLTTI